MPTAATEIVRRYLTEALFGGSERALLDTVSDPQLSERAWLFWAAFGERTLDEIDVLFGNEDGTRVACHLSATVVQEGPWILATASEDGVPATIECTSTFVLTDGRISSFRETWR